MVTLHETEKNTLKTFASEADYLKRKWREACADPATGLELEAFRAWSRRSSFCA